MLETGTDRETDRQTDRQTDRGRENVLETCTRRERQAESARERESILSDRHMGRDRYHVEE